MAMSNIQIIDNLLIPELQDGLEQIFLGQDFPLHLNTSTVIKTDPGVYFDKNTKDYHQLIHNFVRFGEKTNSNFTHWIDLISSTLLKRLEITDHKFWRCKLNVNFPNREFLDHEYFPIHLDIISDQPGLVAIYYINDSDGDTLFFEDPTSIDFEELKIVTSVSPKKGRIVVFNKSVLHSHRPPKNSRVRGVINFNFLI
jgi:hypothetical protein